MDGGFQAVRAAYENLQIRTLKKKHFLYYKYSDFLTIWWKTPCRLVENKKKDGYLGDQARGPGQIQDLQPCTPWTGLVL
jgi:hypothetical protein